jgi:hypothetical protein
MSALVIAMGKALERGVEMRRLQTEYFRLPHGPAKADALLIAKKAEREFDRMARDALRFMANTQETGR